MSQPYVGEIRMFGGSFAPAGWAFCNGAIIPISENDTLFNLIGTTYGGDGQETFGLPDLQGRAPMHQGTLSGGGTYLIGQTGGVENVTLTTQQIPIHNHAFIASSENAGDASPLGDLPGGSTTFDPYVLDAASTAMAPAIQPTGGGQPHENMQPYLVVTFIISLYGIYPTQS